MTYFFKASFSIIVISLGRPRINLPTPIKLPTSHSNRYKLSDILEVLELGITKLGTEND